MYQAAIAQLTVVAETCEHNAPIYAREGNAEQAAHARSQAESCRKAIYALGACEGTKAVTDGNQAGRNHDDSQYRFQMLDLALRTPGLSGHHDVLKAAAAYQAHIAGRTT